MAGIITRAKQSPSKSRAPSQFGSSYTSFRDNKSGDLQARGARMLLLSVGSLGVVTMLLLAFKGIV